MMKIAAIQSGPPPRQVPARATARRERHGSAPSGPSRGKVRHALHGWRSLTAPLVTQILELCSVRAAGPSPQEALRAYRRFQTEPAAPHVVRDI